jgi:hypothetical protein
MTPAGGDTGTWAVGLMLAGRALEVLTKGLLIADNPALLSQDKLPMAIAHHALNRLLRNAGVCLNDEETALVKRLEAFSVWAGCYPTEREWKQPHSAPPIVTEDFQLCRQLFTQVRQQLDKVISGRADTMP